MSMNSFFRPGVHWKSTGTSRLPAFRLCIESPKSSGSGSHQCDGHRRYFAVDLGWRCEKDRVSITAAISTLMYQLIPLWFSDKIVFNIPGSE